MSSYAPCPQCHSTQVAPVKFTWWGGLVGPKLLSHVACGSCGSKYNGKTGRSNTVGIVIYSVVAALMALILLSAVLAALW